MKPPPPPPSWDTRLELHLLQVQLASSFPLPPPSSSFLSLPPFLFLLPSSLLPFRTRPGFKRRLPSKVT